ncbi:MAG: hypothetical protein K2Q26_13765 [Bdellovibrionales bacterium]|nr:hypothetical protein [Bdellovibrionales bacterium]
MFKVFRFIFLFLNISCAAMTYQRLEEWNYITVVPSEDPRLDCGISMVGEQAWPFFQLWDGTNAEVRLETERYFIGRCCKSNTARFIGETKGLIPGKSTKDGSDVQSPLYVTAVKCVK